MKIIASIILFSIISTMFAVAEEGGSTPAGTTSGTASTVVGPAAPASGTPPTAHGARHHRGHGDNPHGSGSHPHGRRGAPNQGRCGTQPSVEAPTLPGTLPAATPATPVLTS